MAQPQHEPELISALGADDPVEALRALAKNLLRRGATRSDITERLERLRDELHAAGRESDEDIVLDVLDFVSGWASPHMKI